MDAGIVRRYVARLAEHEATRGFPLLIGIAPLRAAKSARWMKENLFGTIIADAYIARLEQAADPAAEGRRIAVELIEELATIPGVAGVPHHGAGERGGGAGGDCRSAGAVEVESPLRHPRASRSAGPSTSYATQQVRNDTCRSGWIADPGVGGPGGRQ
jgi:hypothetical protein